ncbi:hypothetical protein QFZ23_004738 [Arthrobacter globiformis]|uniref:hypothetical protein n=1 Tax=Arthrobacter globiformis TaxID=1665 RepID=UPI00277FC8B4|nr:hypothetical protein [Arthrobacter globiformis]MDQ1060773.1 hypothetical protein [Arthrobacter globiformis]
MSYIGSSILGVLSRMPNGSLTAADYENGGIQFVEGRVEVGSLLPVSAALAVGRSFVAVLRGVNPVTGLKMSPQAGDLIVPLSDVRQVTVGGLRADALGKLPVIQGLAWSDGPATIQVANSSGRSAVFKPALFDDGYWGLVNHLVSLLASRADLVEEEADVDEYDIEEPDFGAMVAGALRYFPDTVTNFRELRTLECVLVRGEKSWAGLAILTKKNFGFFEYDECLLEDTDDGKPLLINLKDVSGCSLIVPEDFSLEVGDHIALINAGQPNLIIEIMLDGDKLVRLGIGLPEYTPEELPSLLKLVQKFLNRIDKRLAKRQVISLPQ